MSTALRDLNVLMNRLAGGSSNVETNNEVIIIPADWREDYFNALTTITRKRVFEFDDKGRRHDHTPMPDPSLVTSLQLGFIEKTARPTAKRKPLTPPYRHKLCVEIWTVPHEEIVRHKNSTQWRRFAQLRESTGFETTVRKAHKDGYLRDGFRDWALNMSQGTPSTALWGLFHDSNGGWNYYDEHLVMVDASDPVNPTVTIWRNRSIFVEGLPLSTDFAGHKFPDGAQQTHTARFDV